MFVKYTVWWFLKLTQTNSLTDGFLTIIFSILLGALQEYILNILLFGDN